MPQTRIQRRANPDPSPLLSPLPLPRRRPRLVSMPRAASSQRSVSVPDSEDDIRDSDVEPVEYDREELPEEHLPRDSPNNPFAPGSEHSDGEHPPPGRGRSSHSRSRSSHTSRSHRSPEKSGLERLAEVMERLVNKTSVSPAPAPSSSAKIRKPDVFDGSDSGKLDAFILQCTLTFRANKRAYSTGEDKVTFAISYLKGTALKHFSPGLTQTGNPPEWIDDWELFVDELKSTFGEYDPEGTAERNLRNLRMSTDKPCTEYLTVKDHAQTLAQSNHWAKRPLC